MDYKEKDLLLRCLCARLPYEVIVEVTDINDSTYHKKGVLYKASNIDSNCNETKFLFAVDGEACLCDITEIKPYLRPMSSMTEDEKKEIAIAFNSKWSHANEMDITSDELWKSGREPLGFMAIRYIDMDNVIKYLNAHHLDYRCLIEKGLALEAPKDMYNF